MDSNKDFDKIAEKISKIKENAGLVNKSNNRRNDSRLINLVINSIMSPLVASFIGYMLDKWFDSKPIFLLICLFFGIISSIWQLYKITDKL